MIGAELLENFSIIGLSASIGKTTVDTLSLTSFAASSTGLLNSNCAITIDWFFEVSDLIISIPEIPLIASSILSVILLSIISVEP